MLPAHLYTPLYFHTMLLVVIGCALVYWAGQDRGSSLALFNQAAMVLLGVGVILFIGLRPISGVFVDMAGYARSYERVQQGDRGTSPDWVFNALMWLCSPVLPAEGFFLVCSLIYVAPLVLASWRVHGAWAFPVFLACLTAFSFWGYGVNGIRNGMATSVLLLAFAFHDKPVVMFLLMAAACGLHGSVLLPASAFVIVRYVKRTELWLVFWVLCAVAGLLAGNVGQLLLSRFNPFAWDERIDGYIVAAEDYGFRPGFLAYSILPILATLLLAAPTRARARRLVARVLSTPAIKGMWNRGDMTAKKMSMGRRRLAGLPAGSVGSLALAGFGPTNGDPSSALGATLSTLNSPPSVALAKEDQLPVLRSFSEGGSTRSRTSASARKDLSVPHARVNQNAWNSLPWVQLLRTDAFYARLVNTYLLANAVWVLFIHVRWSNRFAYLSWFLMPWVLLYPFVRGKVNAQPRVGLAAAILTVHYLFTYIMWTVVYRMRFG